MPLDPVIVCNCSICSKTGTMMSFTSAETFKLLSGEEVLTDYLFNKHHIHHLFCSRCGIRSFCRGMGRDGKEMRAINLRCLEGVDLDSLPLTRHDGKSK